MTRSLKMRRVAWPLLLVGAAALAQPGQPEKVVDLNLGNTDIRSPLGGAQTGTVALEDGILFGATDRAGDRSLWRLDHRSGDLQQLTDAIPGEGLRGDGAFPTAGGIPAFPGFAQGEGVVYFPARPGASPTTLWVTDGTPAGTAPLPVTVDRLGQLSALVRFRGGFLFHAVSDTHAATTSIVGPVTSTGVTSRPTASNRIQPTISNSDRPLTNAARIWKR